MMTIFSFFLIRSGALCIFFSLLPQASLLCCGLMVSSPGPCASSGGRLPEARFMVFLLDSKGTNEAVHKCKSCKSRQELSNEYLLAKIGVDTAENRPLKVCKILAKILKKSHEHREKGRSASPVIVSNFSRVEQSSRRYQFSDGFGNKIQQISNASVRISL